LYSIKEILQELEELWKSMPLQSNKLIFITTHPWLRNGDHLKFFEQIYSFVENRHPFYIYAWNRSEQEFLLDIGFKLIQEKKLFGESYWIFEHR